MTKCVYLAGPMSRIAQFNFPLFEAVSTALRADGWTIVSPHECDSEETRAAAWESPDGITTGPGTETWGECLARDVKMLADGALIPSGHDDICGDIRPIDGIAFLPNWEKSRGARLEALVGLLTGKEFYTVQHTVDPEREVEKYYMLECVTAEWVQHMLALDWAEGIRMHKPL